MQIEYRGTRTTNFYIAAAVQRLTNLVRKKIREPFKRYSVPLEANPRQLERHKNLIKNPKKLCNYKTVDRSQRFHK